MSDHKPLLLVFGTSADPMHLGHVSLIIQAVHALSAHNCKVDQILIMPVYRHHNLQESIKRSLPLTFDYRFALCQINARQIERALEGEVSLVRVSRLEQMIAQENNRPNFTAETLATLRRQMDPALDIAFLIGGDVFSGPQPSFERWYQKDKILELATLVISPRAGFEPNLAYLEGLRAKGGRVIYLNDLLLPEISSSLIRARLEAGEEINHLVKEKWISADMARYIRNAGLVSVWKEIDVTNPAYAIEEAITEKDNLETLIGKLLFQQKLTLALAESCTGGLLADRVTNVPGSSEYFIGGIVSYAYEAKVKLLGVQWNTLKKYGAVSAETVLEMARGARSTLNADLGLSVSCIAGPGGATATKPVGTSWCALSAPEGEWAHQFLLQGDRLAVKAQLAEEAFKVLRDYLLKRGTQA